MKKKKWSVAHGKNDMTIPVLRFLATACGIIATYASKVHMNGTSNGNMTITKCTLCSLAVHEAETLIANEGCNIWFDAKAVLICEGLGLGPENPIADLCVPLLIEGCNVIEQNVQKHIVDPNTTCTMLHMC